MTQVFYFDQFFKLKSIFQIKNLFRMANMEKQANNFKMLAMKRIEDAEMKAQKNLFEKINFHIHLFFKIVSYFFRVVY